MFWNGKPVHFYQERCWVLVAGCQENKSCSKVLNFLERLDDRIRCIHEETVAAVKPWEDMGSNKSLGCVFSEKTADWTNAFKLETMISGLTYFYDVLLHGRDSFESRINPRFLAESETGMLCRRAKSNRMREGNCGRFQGRRKGKDSNFRTVIFMR